MKVACKTYKEHLRYLESHFAARDDDNRDMDDLFTRHPELQFCLSVVMPSLVEHEMLPGEMIKRARAHDPTAIENLLRMDPSTSSAPDIAAWIYGGAGAVRGGRVAMAATWMKDGSKGKFGLPGIKQSAAALISVLSEGINFAWDGPWLVKLRPLTARQIRELFDAVAKDRKWQSGFSRWRSILGYSQP